MKKIILASILLLVMGAQPILGESETPKSGLDPYVHYRYFTPKGERTVLWVKESKNTPNEDYIERQVDFYLWGVLDTYKRLKPVMFTLLCPQGSSYCVEKVKLWCGRIPDDSPHGLFAVMDIIELMAETHIRLNMTTNDWYAKAHQEEFEKKMKEATTAE